MVSPPLFAAASSTPGSGYLYELLRTLGASTGTARHVQDLALRPITILLLVVAAAVLSHLGSLVIRRFVSGLHRRASRRPDSRRLESVSSRLDMVGRAAANLFRVVVWVIALLAVLGVLGIDLAPFVAGATVIGATIGFGAQSLVKDFLSGFLLLAEDQYRIGDAIDTASANGVVEEMTLRVTRLRGDDGTTWYVPNGDIRTLGNTSRRSASSSLDVVVPVGAPLERTCQVIAEAARSAVAAPSVQSFCTRPPEVLGVEAADLASLTIRVALHTRPGRAEPVARAVRGSVMSRLVAEEILTPAAPASGG